MTDSSTGILLVNTGSSAAPRTPETRHYLRQFLSDPRIIDLPAWKRWMIVNCFILPFRPKRTAEAYRAIWSERGSPLLAISTDFRDALAAALPEFEVAIGMAYGAPSVAEGLETLLRKPVTRVVLVPLFPQYASATVGSVLEACYSYLAKKWNVPAVSVLPPFYSEEAFLDAWQEAATPHIETFRPDHVLISYHGLPERQILKGDPTGAHCLKHGDCCDTEVPANRFCYRRHCMETTRALAPRLRLREGQYTVSFQSRLGRDPWLGPATDQTVVRLAKQGVKRLAVLSPAFVADCLETLEELGIQAKNAFLAAGGEQFLLMPSLNTHPRWVEALATMLRRI